MHPVSKDGGAVAHPGFSKEGDEQKVPEFKSWCIHRSKEERVGIHKERYFGNWLLRCLIARNQGWEKAEN